MVQAPKARGRTTQLRSERWTVLSVALAQRVRLSSALVVVWVLHLKDFLDLIHLQGIQFGQCVLHGPDRRET